MNPLKALRRIFLKRKHGVITLGEGTAKHSELNVKQRKAAEKAWKSGDVSFSYVVHPLMKFVEIKRANYKDITGLKKVIDEARKLSKKLKLPLRGILEISVGASDRHKLECEIYLQTNSARITTLNMKDIGSLCNGLETAENVAQDLGLTRVWTTYEVPVR